MVNILDPDQILLSAVNRHTNFFVDPTWYNMVFFCITSTNINMASLVCSYGVNISL